MRVYRFSRVSECLEGDVRESFLEPLGLVSSASFGSLEEVGEEFSTNG